jgi:hypothetical protein
MNQGFFCHEAAAAKKQAKEENKKKWLEPKKRWQNSKAKKILFKLLRDGTLPRVQYDYNGNKTMKIEKIFNLTRFLQHFLNYWPVFLIQRK